MRLRLDLDEALGEALLEESRKESRYLGQQIEVILREKLGIPVPSQEKSRRELAAKGGNQ